MIRKGINSEKTKMINRLLVLRMLCTQQTVSRVEITRQVGLAKMTVSNIIAELIANGLICESDSIDTGRTGAGRKQIGLRIASGAPLGIGVWMARDFSIAYLATLDLKILKQYRVDFRPQEDLDTVIGKVVESIEFLQEGTAQKILGVGLVSEGPLNPVTGVTFTVPERFGVEEYPLARALSERLDLPVFLQSEAAAGALAEHYYGAGRDCENFAYLGKGAKLAAGLVLEDNLVEGRHSFAGQIDPQGSDKPIPELLEEILPELCRVADPSLLLLGHGLTSMGEVETAALEAKLNAILDEPGRVPVKIEKAAFGGYAPTYGAVAALFRKIFVGELLYDELFPEGSSR